MITIKYYSANGNTFIVFESINVFFGNYKAIRILTNEMFNCDGVLYIVKIKNDYYFRIFNKDGTEAITCGNGLRIAAKVLLNNRKRLKIKGLHNEYELISKRDRYYVKFPFPKIINNSEKIIINNGNFHELLFVDKIRQDDFQQMDYYKYNCSLIKNTGINSFEILTKERGVGITKSCGSAIISAVYYKYLKNKEIKEYLVKTNGGEFKSIIDKDGILLSGQIEKVFEGEIDEKNKYFE